MGSEQSTQPGNKGTSSDKTTRLKRGKSVPERTRHDSDTSDVERPGSASPVMSVCSDSDLPYISYTVNKPIGGDSPKLVSKHLSRAKSSQMKSSLLRKASQITSSTGHNIVVVKEAAPEESPDTDPELQRLKNIPMFLPIMRGTVNLPEARDPEVLERLDSAALYRLCVHYQEYMNKCATTVAKDQALIFDDMKKVDAQVAALVKSYSEHEARVRVASERLHRLPELSQRLSSVHLALNQTVDSLERLNNSLPVEHRLEPFVWTTG